MPLKWNLLGSIAASVAALVLIGWGLWRWLKRSDEPLVLIVRWIITAVVLGFVFRFAARAHDEFSMIAAILLGAVGGLIMVFVWRERFCGLVADQFASLSTGGSEQPDPAAFYSIAEAKRKKGQYLEAVAEVRAQLERFPTDFRGWMLLAEIQAENLKDLAGACASVKEVVRQKGHAPKNIAYALTRAADWHLKLAQDREGARAALERIVEVLPETEQAQLALQRIAHLTPQEMLAEEQSPRRMAVEHHHQRLGLDGASPDVRPPEQAPEEAVAEYVRHLEQFPYDNEAREKLALLYARHSARLDLAIDQLEQLISFPNQPAREVVRWLNLLADLQVQVGGDLEMARTTLRRIVELYPGSAAAQNALSRIARLKLEMRPKEQSPAVRLGSYEQNIGLKQGPVGPPFGERTPGG
jgi:tetratricopeptide (TPR) repeat protein